MGEADILLDVHRRHERADDAAVDAANRRDHAADAAAVKFLVDQPHIIASRIDDALRVAGDRRADSGRELDLVIEHRDQVLFRIRHANDNLLANDTIQIRSNRHKSVQNILICLDRIGISHEHTSPLYTLQRNNGFMPAARHIKDKKILMH